MEDLRRQLSSLQGQLSGVAAVAQAQVRASASGIVAASPAAAEPSTAEVTAACAAAREPAAPETFARPAEDELAQLRAEVTSLRTELSRAGLSHNPPSAPSALAPMRPANAEAYSQLDARPHEARFLVHHDAAPPRPDTSSSVDVVALNSRLATLRAEAAAALKEPHGADAAGVPSLALQAQLESLLQELQAVKSSATAMITAGGTSAPAASASGWTASASALNVCPPAPLRPASPQAWRLPTSGVQDRPLASAEPSAGRFVDVGPLSSSRGRLQDCTDGAPRASQPSLLWPQPAPDLGERVGAGTAGLLAATCQPVSCGAGPGGLAGPVRAVPLGLPVKPRRESSGVPGDAQPGSVSPADCRRCGSPGGPGAPGSVPKASAAAATPWGTRPLPWPAVVSGVAHCPGQGFHDPGPAGLGPEDRVPQGAVGRPLRSKIL